MSLLQTSVESFPTSRLAELGAQETQRYRAGSPFDQRYMLEVFRRAIALRDEEAWQCLYQHYAPVVRSWLERSRQRDRLPILLLEEDSATLVNAVFSRFARALPPQKWQAFSSLAAVLAYLKRCAHAVMVDALAGAQQRPHMISLEESETQLRAADPADQVLEAVSLQECWAMLMGVVRGDRERLVLFQSLVRGETPAHIQQCYPHLFPQVEEVYRLKRNVLERLRRHPTVCGWQEGRG